MRVLLGDELRRKQVLLTLAFQWRGAGLGAGPFATAAVWLILDFGCLRIVFRVRLLYADVDVLETFLRSFLRNLCLRLSCICFIDLHSLQHSLSSQRLVAIRQELSTYASTRTGL